MFCHGFRRISAALSHPGFGAGVLCLSTHVLARRRNFTACEPGIRRDRGFSSDGPARRILIDTDPGVDDALAILLASGSPELKLEGLSIAFGNGKDIAALGSNAKMLLRLVGLTETPVALGAQPDLHDGEAGAMVSREGMKKALVHGEDHMGNVSAKYGKDASDRTGFHELAAPEFIYEMCKCSLNCSPREITLVCIGPLHNLAAALDSHPDLPQLLREVVIMGGAFGERRGNRTPSAEANFFDGPEAAQAVLTAGFERLVLAGLDITHQTDMLVLRKECLESGSALSQFVWELCENFINVYHAALPVRSAIIAVMMASVYLLRPDLFESQKVRVEVETRGEITRGMSIADWKGQWGKDFVVRLSGALRELSESGKEGEPTVRKHAQGLHESCRRFQLLARSVPEEVSRWKDGDFASAVEDLQEQDSRLMEELQRVAGEAEELRKKSEEAVWEVSGRLIGSEDDLERDDPRPEEEASTVPSAASVRPKLQDLAQHRSRRFAEELEFVQCLANPSYVMWLASQGFLGDTGFAHFLDYLCYWRRPQYVRYITYPASLAMLDLLRDPAVRGRLQRKDAESFLSSNLLHAWGKVKEVRLGPEADLAGTEAVEDPIIDEAAPKSPTGDSSITAGIFSNAGATGPDKGQAKAWLKRRLQKQAEGTRARTLSEEAESVARPLLLPVCGGSAEKLEQVVKKRKQTWQDPSDGAKGDLAEVSRRPPLDPVPSKAISGLCLGRWGADCGGCPRRWTRKLLGTRIRADQAVSEDGGGCSHEQQQALGSLRSQSVVDVAFWGAGEIQHLGVPHSARLHPVLQVTGVNEEDQISTCLKVAAEAECSRVKMAFQHMCPYFAALKPGSLVLEVGSRSGDVTVMFAERFPELLRWLLDFGHFGYDVTPGTIDVPESELYIQPTEGTGDTSPGLFMLLQVGTPHNGEERPATTKEDQEASENVPRSRVLPPKFLDGGKKGWRTKLGQEIHCIFCVNVLHYVSPSGLENFMQGCSDHLPVGGMLLVSGPFFNNGEAAETLLVYDAALRAFADGPERMVGIFAARLTVLSQLFVKHKHKMASFENLEGMFQWKSSQIRLLILEI
ncbi:URH2 [Symbiodinium sp. KB8]|nr:URH2 [Symbiodinium sp. KB8]